jgi:hypothetical protein
MLCVHVSTKASTFSKHIKQELHTLILLVTAPIGLCYVLVRVEFDVQLGVKDFSAPDGMTTVIIKYTNNEPRPAVSLGEALKALGDDKFGSWVWEKIGVHLNVSAANVRILRHEGRSL